MASGGPQDTIKNITEDVRSLVQAEVALAKAELAPKVKAAGMGAGLFGGAGYLVVNAIFLLFVSASIGVGILLGGAVGVVPGIALGFLIVAVAMLIIAGLCVFIGQAQIKRLMHARPELAITNAQDAIVDVQNAVARGNDAVPSSIFGRLNSTPD